MSIFVSESERCWRMLEKEGREDGDECLESERSSYIDI